MAIILPSGFVITNNEPVDSRLSVADSASRFSLSVNNVYEGITVYERDTNIIYVLTDATAPSSASSWVALISNTSSSIATSASYSTTASYALSGNGSFTGSFTGSFIGDGAGLINIPASGITGLNLSQIASGSVTASISPDIGFQVNTRTNISGNLTVTGSLNVVKSINGVFDNTFTNINPTGYTGITAYTENGAYYGGIAIFNVSGGVGTLYDSNTSWFAANTPHMGLINENPTGDIVFATGTYGSAGEKLRLTTSSLGAIFNTPITSYRGAFFTGSLSTDLVRITQTGIGNAFVVEDSTNPDATPFVINNAGRVGIGTTTITSASLQINGNVFADSYTGSLQGTASYSTQNLSSSYAATASVAPAYLPLTGGTITGNLTVIGTSSFVYTTSSIVNVGNNTVLVNTNYPAIRFGGISVVDSGSFGYSSTGSLLWDSLNNRWIYSNPSGSTYDGGILIAGPKNTSGLGNESGMTENFVAVGQGTDHIQPGTIFNSGSITQVTGSLFVTAGVTGSFTGSFTGNGSGLTNIPAAGIIGLNLSQISSGSVSASISPNLGLQINTNVTATSFTGSFSGSGAGLSGIFPVTTNAQILISTGSVLAARSVTGDIAITNAGVTTIQTGAVTFSKIQTLSQAALIGTTSSLGGTVQEIPIIEAYVPTGSAFTALLENTANWDINGVYIGSTITGTYQGQSHLNNDYWFTAVADNNWIRLIRG